MGSTKCVKYRFKVLIYIRVNISQVSIDVVQNTIDVFQRKLKNQIGMYLA